jgi:hypothetical protein
MASDFTRFTQFLVDECEDTESTAFVDSLLASAKAAILEGNGAVAFVQAASANGKTVHQFKEFTCAEVAEACRKALRIYADTPGSGPIVFPDFSATFLP